ncbi:MAG TPA: ABC transporter permease [Gemmatimonadaceae bacterium]
MGKLLVVFKREYLERVRSRWFVIGTLLGPAFLLLIVGAPRLMGDRSEGSRDVARIDVIDATGTGLGNRVADALRAKYPLSRAPYVRTVDASKVPLEEDRSVLRVQRDEVLGALVLDSTTIKGDSVRYAGRNAGSHMDVDAIRNVVRNVVLADQMASAGIDAKQVDEFSHIRLDIHVQKIGDKGLEKGNPIAVILLGYGVALLLYMMIVVYGQAIMRSVLEEKSTRVAEVVVSSVDTDTLLAGKILGVGLVAITQVVSWIVLGAAALMYFPQIMGGGDAMGGVADSSMVSGAASGAAGGASAAAALVKAGLPTVPVWATIALFLCFVLGFIFYASLFAAVGAMVNSQEDVQQAATPVMLLLVSSAIFMGPIMANPTSNLAKTMSILPTSAPIIMPLRMTLVPVPWIEIVGALAGVSAACAAAIWLSGRIYRVGLLMYGKKPTIRELAKWVKEAR